MIQVPELNEAELTNRLPRGGALLYVIVVSPQVVFETLTTLIPELPEVVA